MAPPTLEARQEPLALARLQAKVLVQLSQVPSFLPSFLLVEVKQIGTSQAD